MKILEVLSVDHQGRSRRIELCAGDLTDLGRKQSVDILVVSAFPDDYTPTEFSLIGALDRKGISLAKLANAKRVDLRTAFSCWLSDDLSEGQQAAGFKRILCFEPATRGAPPELIGDIFRSLAPFLMEEYAEATVAMPIVASGDQSWPEEDILAQILDAATHWLAQGLPLQCLKIVELSSDKAERLRSDFTAYRERYQTKPAPPANRHKKFDAWCRPGCGRNLAWRDLR